MAPKALFVLAVLLAAAALLASSEVAARELTEETREFDRILYIYCSTLQYCRFANKKV